MLLLLLTLVMGFCACATAHNGPVDVLLLGETNRAPHLLAKTIDDLSILRSKGIVDEIVIVCSIPHAREHKERLDTLVTTKGISVRTYEEPTPLGISNIWAQMTALYVGLDQRQPDKLVLKTRSDVYIEPELLELIVTTPDYLKVAPEAPHVFHSRIWVPWMELSNPFWIADEIFLGRADDLATLGRNLQYNMYPCS